VGTIQTFFFHIRSGAGRHPILAIGAIAALLIGVVLYLRRKSGRRGSGSILPGSMGGGGGFFRLDGKEGLLGGGGTNGKVD
jgi:protein disulfide-isomerase